MSKKEYPKFKYHSKFDPVVVLDSDEEKSLGAGWGNSPAEFKESAALIAKEPEEHVKAMLAVRQKKAAASVKVTA